MENKQKFKNWMEKNGLKLILESQHYSENQRETRAQMSRGNCFDIITAKFLKKSLYTEFYNT